MPLPSQVHVPTSMDKECDYHVEKRGNKWVLIAKASGKLLGEHDSEAGAQEQERAIQAHKNMSLAETFNINGVEIFAAGEWNGDAYSTDDLDELARAFEETREHLKPYLKLGHGNSQKLLASDELPAAGWLTNVYREGGKLLADFAKVPKKIYELIKAGAYSRVSSEIFINPKVNGKPYKMALKAVAILGGETPAVHTLDDIHALYVVDQSVRAYEKDAQVKVYEMDSKEDADMKTAEELQKELNTASEKIAELSQKHSDAAGRVVVLEKEVVEAKAKNESLQKEFSAAKGQLEAVAQDKRKGDITAKLDKLVSEKKIMPAQKEVLFTLLDNAQASGERKFKIGEKEYPSVEALVFAFIDSGNPTGLNTEVKSETGKDQGDLAVRAKEYAEKNKVSYKAALIAVSGGELKQ